MLGTILHLDTGITVVLVGVQQPGHWYRAHILHSKNDHYPAGGQNIVVGPNDIAEARVVHITDTNLPALLDGAEVHGPIPTMDDLLRQLRTTIGARE